MQNFRCVVTGALAMAFVSGAAFAQTAAYSGEAKLVSALSSPHEQVIGGANWRCEGDQCQGAADRKGNLDGLVRECKKVVAVVGPVASYRSGGRELSDGQIRACNKGAIKVQTVAN